MIENRKHAQMERILPVTQNDPPAMAVKVNAGEYLVNGYALKITTSSVIPISPPETLQVVGEEVVISDETHREFIGGTMLSKTAGPIEPGVRLPGAIVAESVEVRSKSTGCLHAEGTDYFLEHSWGGLSRIETGNLSKDERIVCDYQVWLQRIDVVEVSESGEVAVKCGLSSQVCPEIPRPDPGCRAVAHIYIGYGTSAITRDCVFVLPESDTGWRELIRVRGREHLSNSIRLLKNKGTLRIVCWGDSVTEGASASTPDRSYCNLFKSRLAAHYDHPGITLINAGIGASNTNQRIHNFDEEVLAHNPDLITVEFVNDAALLPAEDIRSNLSLAISKARAANVNSEIIIITPHLMNMPEWMVTFDDAVEAMRRVAEDEKVALADTTAIWMNLKRIGIPYQSLLTNMINHPNDLGHEFFAESIYRLLTGVGDERD